MGYFSELDIVGREQGVSGMRQKVYDDLKKSGMSHSQALRGVDVVVAPNRPIKVPPVTKGRRW